MKFKYLELYIYKSLLFKYRGIINMFFMYVILYIFCYIENKSKSISKLMILMIRYKLWKLEKILEWMVMK